MSFLEIRIEVKPCCAQPWESLGKSCSPRARGPFLCVIADPQHRDLADTFPHGEYANLFRQEWLTVLIKDVKTNRDFQPRTIETARWAREQVKRQTGNAPTGQTMS